MWSSLVKGMQELSRYLLYLRVQLLALALAVLVFLTQQVRDVLLAMALEPDWSGFRMAALFSGLFGVMLWFSARSISELRWMRNPKGRERLTSCPATGEGNAGRSRVVVAACAWLGTVAVVGRWAGFWRRPDRCRTLDGVAADLGSSGPAETALQTHPSALQPAGGEP